MTMFKLDRDGRFGKSPRAPKLRSLFAIGAVAVALIACDREKELERPTAVESSKIESQSPDKSHSDVKISGASKVSLDVEPTRNNPSQLADPGFRNPTVVSLGGALTSIGEIQARRNQRHNLTESGSRRRIVTLRDALVALEMADTGCHHRRLSRRRRAKARLSGRE